MSPWKQALPFHIHHLPNHAQRYGWRPHHGAAGDSSPLPVHVGLPTLSRTDTTHQLFGRYGYEHTQQKSCLLPSKLASSTWPAENSNWSKIKGVLHLPIPRSKPRFLSSRYSWHSARCSQQQCTRKSGHSPSSTSYSALSLDR